jgi:hypothetical protein
VETMFAGNISAPWYRGPRAQIVAETPCEQGAEVSVLVCLNSQRLSTTSKAHRQRSVGLV